MGSWDLPTSAEINGREFEVNTDFRAVLDVISVMSDPELGGDEKGYVALNVFYPDFEDMRRADYEDAAAFMNWFVDGGQEQNRASKARLMDWEQDFALISAPVNRVLGFECRTCEYLHWWTFLAAYMEIGDCLFANVVSCRKKKAQGRMDKSDRDFYRRNKKLVDFKVKTTEVERQAVSEWIG